MKDVVFTPDAPAAIGPYSQGIKAGGFVYTSGQLPIGKDGVMEENDMTKAAALCLENIKAVLETAGASVGGIVKTTCFLTDLADFAAVNAAYTAFFTDAPPARSCVQVAALPKGARVEIEAIAVIA